MCLIKREPSYFILRDVVVYNSKAPCGLVSLPVYLLPGGTVDVYISKNEPSAYI
ncbi:hypothetical protein [Faecalicatena contorta]|uniref:hypothetical protein n=1 Tax=Faecalicatena contorta TaxID=39482 RepID=UPI0015E86783|nr:hypothetical protein [Faecalicatena contorta]